MKPIFVTLLMFISISCQSESINDRIDKIASNNNFSGAILIAVNDSIIINKAYGHSDKQRLVENKPNTIFPIASITKLFIKQSILSLVSSHHLSLDDTLSKYISCIRYSDKITISDLLYHKSGLPDIHNRIQLFNDPEQLNDTITETELLNFINSFQQLEFTPGSRVSYSNSNYLILSFIIEKITKASLDEYLYKTIFLPYNMQQTGLYNYYSTKQGHTAGFFYQNNTIEYVPDFNFRYFWGSGNAYSTTQDLYKYYKNSQRKQKTEISNQIVQHSGYYLGFRTYYKVIPEIGFALIILSNNGNFNTDLITNEFVSYVKEVHLAKYRQRIIINESLTGKYCAKRLGELLTVEIVRDNNELKINNFKLVPIGNNSFLLDNNSLTSVLFKIKNEDEVELIMNDNGEMLVLKKL